MGRGAEGMDGIGWAAGRGEATEGRCEAAGGRGEASGGSAIGCEGRNPWAGGGTPPGGDPGDGGVTTTS